MGLTNLPWVVNYHNARTKRAVGPIKWRNMKNFRNLNSPSKVWELGLAKL